MMNRGSRQLALALMSASLLLSVIASPSTSHVPPPPPSAATAGVDAQQGSASDASLPPRGGQLLGVAKVRAADLTGGSAIWLSFAETTASAVSADVAQARTAVLRGAAGIARAGADVTRAAATDSAVLVGLALGSVAASPADVDDTVPALLLNATRPAADKNVARLYATLACEAAAAASESPSTMVVIRFPRNPLVRRPHASVASPTAAMLLLEHGERCRGRAVTFALFAEPLVVTSVVARVDLPAATAPGTYDVRMRNTSFGARFRVAVAASQRTGVDRSVAWTVLRPARRVPGLVAAVYDSAGVILSSAAVQMPSQRGVTFENILGNVRVANAHHRSPRDNGTTDRALLESHIATTAGKSRTTHQLRRFHLAVDFYEAYREHFGEVVLGNFQDVFDDLSSEGEAANAAVILSERAFVPGTHAAVERDLEPSVHFRFEASARAGGEASNLRAVDLTVVIGCAATDVQVSVIDGAGTAVFSWDAQLPSSSGAHSFGADGASLAASKGAAGAAPPQLSLTWRGALQVPAHGYGGDLLRLAVRFNAATNQTANDDVSDDVDVPVDAASAESAASFPPSALLTALEANGAWVGDVEPVLVKDPPTALSTLHAAANTGRWALRASQNLPSKRVVLLLPPQATLTVSDVYAALPALARLVKSEEWRRHLDGNRIAREPHTSAFITTVGLLLGLSLGGDSNLGAAIAAELNRTAALVADGVAPLWSEDERERLLRLPDGSLSGAGHEAQQARSLWDREFELLRRLTSFERPADDFLSARAAVAIHLKAVGVMTAAAATAGGEPPIAFMPLAASLPHADARFAVSEHLDRSRAHLQRAAERNPRRRGSGAAADGSIVIATRREVPAGEVLCTDLSQGGQLSDLEVFARHGIVVDVPEARATVINGSVVKASADGARGLLGMVRETAAGRAPMEAARQLLAGRHAALAEAIAKGEPTPRGAPSRTSRRRWRAVERLLHHEALAVRSLVDELDVIAEDAESDL